MPEFRQYRDIVQLKNAVSLLGKPVKAHGPILLPHEEHLPSPCKMPLQLFKRQKTRVRRAVFPCQTKLRRHRRKTAVNNIQTDRKIFVYNRPDHLAHSFMLTKAPNLFSSAVRAARFHRCVPL